MKTLVLACLGLTLAAPGALAQAVGGPLNDHRFSAVENGVAADFADLQGRLVLVEYFAYW